MSYQPITTGESTSDRFVAQKQNSLHVIERLANKIVTRETRGPGKNNQKKRQR